MENTTMERIMALAELLEVTTEEIEQSAYDETRFYVDNEEYLVLTDEEADDTFYEMEESLIDDLGLSAFSDWAKEYLLDMINEDAFYSDMEASYESYCTDIEGEEASSDEYENRLEEEMAEANCETLEEYIDYLCEQQTSLEWMKEIGNEDYILEVAVKNGDLDMEDVINWIKEQDGRGTISSWDGIENEVDDYFIYRLN